MVENFCGNVIDKYDIMYVVFLLKLQIHKVQESLILLVNLYEDTPSRGVNPYKSLLVGGRDRD